MFSVSFTYSVLIVGISSGVPVGAPVPCISPSLLILVQACPSVFCILRPLDPFM